MNLRNKLREAIVDLNKAAKSEPSGFKAHNPEIAEFARKSPENLATVIAFCIGTQQVEWPIIAGQFGELVATLHDKGKIVYDKSSAYEPVVGGNSAGMKINSINRAWENRNKYFDDFYGPLGILGSDFKYNTCGIENSYKAYQLHLYIVKGISGLALTKAGFLVQLVTGMSGCFDSINRQLYFIRGDMYDKVFSKGGSIKKPAAIHDYQDLIKNYDKMLHTFHKYEDATELSNYRLWDDWCRIVAQRIAQMNRTSLDNAKAKTDTTVTAKLGRQTQDIGVYNKRFQDKYPNIKNYVDKSANITGFDVSKQHRDVMNPGYKGESLANKFKESLNKYLVESDVIPEAEFMQHSYDRLKTRINVMGLDDLTQQEMERINYSLAKIKEIKFPANKSYAIMLTQFKPNPQSNLVVKSNNGQIYYQIGGDKPDDMMKPSIGDQLWVIVRNNHVITAFLRQSSQTADLVQNSSKLYVDNSIKNIDNFKPNNQPTKPKW